MNKIWDKIETFTYFIVNRVLKLSIRKESLKKSCEFIKFGIVGFSNTIISYIIYGILVAVSVHYLIASLAGFFVSVINAYFWNNKYVFEKEINCERVWWKVFLKTFMAYAGTGLLLNNALLILWINIFHIPEMIGPILNLFITIPINFLLNKYWAFKNNSKNN